MSTIRLVKASGIWSKALWLFFRRYNGGFGLFEAPRFCVSRISVKRARRATSKSSQALLSRIRTTSPRPEPSKADSFPVVGIGASAGGLEAFKELLTGLPEKDGDGLCARSAPRSRLIKAF